MPVEVIKVQEVEKIVEVFRDRFVPKEESEDCDCLTGIKFIEVWNKIFQLKGVSGTECLTQEEFVTLLQKNFQNNTKALLHDPARMSHTTNFRSTVDSETFKKNQMSE